MHHLRQAPRLVLEAFGGGSAFLHQCSVLLRHFFQRPHGVAHFGDALALLLRGGGDLGHDAGDLPHRLHQLRDAVARVVDERGARLNLLGAVVDERLDFACRVGRATCQAAHLAGHHGKAPALLARAGSFHGGVERQDVGLEGNAVDHAGDVGNLARAGADGVHGLHHLGHHFASFCRRGGCFGRQAVGLMGGLRTLRHGARGITQRLGGALQVVRRLLGADAQVLVA